MPDDQITAPEPITKITITSRGTSVTIESAERLALVAAAAQELHREAHTRCNADLPAGFGGAL